MSDRIEEHREQQRALYGATLGELTSRVTEAMGITQKRLSEVLGVSSPMLSQLVTAQRVKMGNPLAVARLQALLDLADIASTLSREELEARLEAIRAEERTLTETSRASDPWAALLAAARPEELLEAASRLEDMPALATALRRAAGRS